MNDPRSPSDEPFAPADETRAAADVFVEAFLEQWTRGGEPRIEEHLPDADEPHHGEVLIRLVEADLRQRIARGEPARLEDYARRFPRLVVEGRLPDELIAAEFVARQQSGEEPRIDEYRSRFSEQVEPLCRRLGLEGTGGAEQRSPAVAPAAPKETGRSSTQDTETPELGPGSVVGDFEIVRLLGAGSLARVYLAHQQSLHRTVALKVSARSDDEARTLARLEHDHVVSIFSEHAESGYRLLAMRYVPGCTAAELLQEMQAAGGPPASGRALLETIDRLARHAATNSDHGSGTDFGARSTKQIGRGANGARDASGGIAEPPAKAGCTEPAGTQAEVNVHCEVHAGSDESVEWGAGTEPGASAGADASARDAEHADDTLERRQLAGDSYARAICRLMLGLARALEHAHRRGVLHRDIKPANILFATNGRALLMDFNVSVRTSAESERHAGVGGTLAYMAPEHLARFAPEASRDLAPLDERSDLYSLGIVFYELLSGTSPFAEQHDAGSLLSSVNRMLAERSRGPRPLPAACGAPPSLRSIIARCLAPAADDRYRSAAELAEDLECLLSDEPLRHAPETSRGERARKWLRRHPRLVSAASAALLVAGLAIAAIGMAESRRWREAQALLQQAQLLYQANALSEAARVAARAEGLLAVRQYVFPMFGGRGKRAETSRQLAALSGRIADAQYRQFEQMVDTVRAGRPDEAIDTESAQDLLSVYGVLERPDWQRQPAYRQLDADRRRAVDENVTELLLVRMMDLIEQAVDADDRAAKLREARELLRRVPAEHRRQAALAMVGSRLQKAVMSRSGEKMPAVDHTAEPAADRMAGRNEFDEYLLGVAAAKRGDYRAAVNHLERCLDLRRQSGQKPRYWAQFLLAVCLEQLGRYEEAIAAYGTCMGLRPGAAWPCHNLGLIYASQNKLDLAERCFHDALEQSPNLVPALINLGVVLHKKGQYDKALEVLNRAIELGGETADALANRAAVKSALGDPEGALNDLRRALEIDPQHALARRNLKQIERQKHDRSSDAPAD